MSILRSILLAILPTAIVVSPYSTLAEDQAGLDYFEKNVRPLLAKHCYECHSEKAGKKKGGLLLDRKSGWVVGGDSGPAVFPQRPNDSLLIDAVKYESIEMPPSGKLSPAEIGVLEKWVRMGAPDPRSGLSANTNRKIDFTKARETWTFSSPSYVDFPDELSVSQPSTGRSMIDRFVSHQLAQSNIKPVALASKRVWIRRVTFDLVGLPPTAAEVDAFLADSTEYAKQRVVDRLLASDQFGVHWARHWFDVARYADSNGGDINLTYFNAWRYRDFVVDAFNSDKPYDQFVRQQIAGDLMPAADDAIRSENLIATGFLCIGPKMLSERNKEKLYMDVVDEQIDTIGRVFLGLTIGCARCHDHKFDPIPVDDYYALAGIFRSSETIYGIRMGNVNVSGWLEQELPIDDELRTQIERHAAETKRVSAELAAIKNQLGKAASTTPKAKDLGGIVVDDTQATIVGNWTRSTFSKRFVENGYIHDNKQELGKKSVTFAPTIKKPGKYEVRISFPGANGRASNVPVVVRSAEGDKRLLVDQTKLAEHGGLFQTLGEFRFDSGTKGFVRISNENANGFVIADAAQFLLKDESAKRTPPPNSKRTTEAKELREHLSKQRMQLEAKLKELKAAAPKKPMAMSIRDHKTVADTELRIRGIANNRSRPVARGFLQVFAHTPAYHVSAKQSGRLDLANWITDPKNPLTARVMVNRVWSHLMGDGLVRSVDNFGALGDRPSHPQLLDNLAVGFSKSWSIKKLIRQICLSETYGRGTALSERAIAADPENRLRWRQNRRRLPAESIRDALLVASGQVSLETGGSTVANLSESAVANSAGDKKEKSKTKSARRSLYLPIIRNDLPTFLTVFDFADPDMVTGRRNVTNVPAQALLMMNSPFVRDCARRTIAKTPPAVKDADPNARIQWLYQRLLTRPASQREVDRCLEFVSGDDDWVTLCHTLMASSEFRILE